MLRPVSIAALAAAPFLLPVPSPATAALDACPDELPHQPVVLYEVSGFTLGGFVDRELVVYHDGSARLSSASAGGDGSSRTAFVGSESALSLLSDLASAGAFQLCDQVATISDLPTSTLTVVRPQTDARAHTFSWLSAEDPYGPVVLRLEGFIASAFP